jgi:hypothetical protein
LAISIKINSTEWELPHTLFTVEPFLKALYMDVFHGTCAFARRDKFIRILVLVSEADAAGFLD